MGTLGSIKCAMMHSILLCLSPGDFTCQGRLEIELALNGLKFFENPGEGVINPLSGNAP
jgi:hypothetical protein